MASTTPAAERAGVAAAVQGDVTLTGKPRPEPVAADSGMDVLRFDRVLTERQARMQILLENKTTFSVGPASEIVIDEYVYEPDKGVVDITADFVEGVFRYVSGTAAKPADRNVEIQTDAGTVGVRGTSMFVTSRGGDGDGDGGDGNVFVGLLGPGTGNNAGMNDGGVVVSNAQGTTTVSREGFGVSMSEGQAPSAPQEIPDTLVSEVQSSMSGGGGSAPDQEQDAGGGATGDGATSDALNKPEQTSGQTLAEAAQTTTPESDVTPRSNDPTEAENNDTPTGKDTTTREDLDPKTDTVADLQNVEVVQNSDGSLTATLDEELVTASEDLLDQTVQNANLADVAFTTLGWTGVDNLDLHITGPDSSGTIRDVWEGAPEALAGVDLLSGSSFEAATLVDLNSGTHHVTAHNPADFQADGSVNTSFLAGNDAAAAATVTLIPMSAISRGSGGKAEIDPSKILTVSQGTGGPDADTWIAGEIDGSTGDVSLSDQLEQVGASQDVVDRFN